MPTDYHQRMPVLAGAGEVISTLHNMHKDETEGIKYNKNTRSEQNI